MLFKGKTKSDGKVIKGHFFEDGKFSYIICNDTSAISKHGDRSGSIRYYMVEPESVGVYTGLTDRNEKMVFEKDWIELLDGSIHLVIFKEGAFGIELSDDNFKLLRDLRKPMYMVKTESGESIIIEYECLFSRVNEKDLFLRKLSKEIMKKRNKTS